MKKFSKIVLPLMAFAPALVFAQNAGNFGGIRGIICGVGGLVKYLIILLNGVALLVFIWGLIKFVSRAGNVQEKEKGKGIMIWGLIALFVMVSVWGIISFVKRDLGIPNPTGTSSSSYCGGSSGGQTPTPFPLT